MIVSSFSTAVLGLGAVLHTLSETLGRLDNLLRTDSSRPTAIHASRSDPKSWSRGNLGPPLECGTPGNSDFTK